MYTRQITSEETYTLAEARRIISVENTQRREIFIEKIQKKAMGVFCIVIGIIGAAVTHDATPLFMLLCSIYFFKGGEK